MYAFSYYDKDEFKAGLAAIQAMGADFDADASNFYIETETLDSNAYEIMLHPSGPQAQAALADAGIATLN